MSCPAFENLNEKRKEKERRFLISAACLLLIHGASEETKEGIGVEGRQGQHGLCLMEWLWAISFPHFPRQPHHYPRP
jgi:hypothetical protein